MSEDKRQEILSDEEAERELEEAEEAFGKSDAVTDMQVANTEEQVAKTNMQILVALGFRRYDDKDETNFNMRVMNIKIGVKFNDNNPTGKVWAYELAEDNKKNFFKNGDLKQLPVVQRYYNIQEGKEPIPEITVTGKITEKHGKAIKVEIAENGELKELTFGLGAVKKDKDGHFIPGGFSKATEKNPEQKMDIPRDIRLPDYETQLEQAPIADTAKEESKERAEKGTLADVIHKEPVPLIEGEKPTVDYYINLIGEITEKVRAEERISEREQGYAISKVFDAITRDTRTALIAELKNGGNDHEE